MERHKAEPSSKCPKITRIVKEHVKELEESLVGVLKETFGAGLTPPNRSTAAALSCSLDLSEGSNLFMAIHKNSTEITVIFVLLDDFVTLKKAKNLSKLSTSKTKECSSLCC